MKLRTSFFNGRVLLKNLTRFAPLWVLFAVAEVIGLLSIGMGNEFYHVADDLQYIVGPASIFHAVYAFLVAACLFGDLFDSRMCNGLHAMPMRREGWLITNVLSGLVFALIPALVGGVFGMILLGQYWWLSPVWQAASLLQFLFFFGLAVFSALCAGKRLGMAAIYAICNFLSMLIYWLATLVYEPLLFGVELGNDWFTLFCPLVTMVQSTYFEIELFRTETVMKAVFQGFEPEGWIYLAACVGVGLLFTALSFLLYKKRHLETAGDFISFRPMGIFFLLAYTLAMGAFVYSFGELFGIYADYGFLVVGILVGFFTGWMLLERTVRIFTKKVLLSFVAFAVVFSASLGLAAWDPLGITTYVPEEQKVEKACLYLQKDRFYFESNDLTKGWYVTDPAQIGEITGLHTKMLSAPRENEGEYITVYVRYRLKNGTSLCRRYEVSAEAEITEELALWFSDIRSVLGSSDVTSIKENLLWANIYQDDKGEYAEMDAAQLQRLFAAIEADAAAGNLAQHDYFHPGSEYLTGIDLTWGRTLIGRYNGEVKESYGTYISVYDDCENIRAFMETLDETQ